MNGFANAILSLLLGWLRSLFDAMWTLFGSDQGGVLRFLQKNWVMVFLVLCIGGFIVDRLIYLIRWRPYYVWYARRERRKRMAEEAAHEQAGQPHPRRDNRFDPYDVPEGTEAGSQAFSFAADTRPYAPYAPAAPEDDPTYPYPMQTAGDARAYPDDLAAQGRYAQPSGAQGGYGYAPQSARMPAYAPPPYEAQPYAQAQDTSGYRFDDRFAPTASYSPIAHTPVQMEPMQDEPRFDEDFAPWTAPQSTYDDLPANRDLAYGISPSFGTSKPEPMHYLEDVQAGYAPEPEPAQRYAPRQQPAQPPPGEPVHPGLDLETFQQNIGIPDPASLTASDRRDVYADFTPYPVSNRGDPSGAKPKGIGALAQKARTLISGEDERNPRSIHDMQSTVDMKNAFHAPVYPKKKPESEEE